MAAQTGVPAELQELAEARYEETTTLRNVAVAAAVSAWLATDDNNLASSFISKTLPKLLAILRGSQRKVAEGAQAYILDSLQAQNIDVRFAGDIDPLAFTGANDGRNIERALVQPVIETKYRIARGVSPREAMRDSRYTVERMVSTEIMDSSRQAQQAAIVAAEPAPNATLPAVKPETRAERKELVSYLNSESAEKPIEVQTNPNPTKKAAKLDKFGNPMGGRFGYIRMLNLPSCSRCALLAGRWYGWNAGFKRHEVCDCFHIPCLLANPDVPDMLVDPMAYFKSLDEADQNKYFGVNASRALREEGADIYQIVNATSRKGAVSTVGGRKYTNEAVTRRGIYGQAAKKGGRREPRLTPEQIYKDAGSDRIEAVRLLTKYGYIVP